MTASARLEVRISPQVKDRLTQAAALSGSGVSEFVRSAVKERIAEVIAEHEQVTRVPADFFDNLVAALDEPGQPSEPLTRGARRAQATVTRG